MKKFLIINNPKAGRKKAVKYKKAIIKSLLRQNVEFKSIGIDENVEEAIGDADVVIVVGGDGSINRVIPYIIDTDKILGIIPSGTANLLAAKLGISTNLSRALKVIENGKISQIDALKVNDEMSVLRTGFGYDADIICKTPQSLKNKFGYFAYFLAGILFALRLRQKAYTIMVDGVKHKTLATCIIVANAGNMYKNLISISNNCELDDGLFDVFILKVKNPIMFFIEFLMIVFNIKLTNTKAVYFKTSALKIKNDITTVHIDGEKRKLKGDISINIAHKSVKVFSNL